VLARPAGERTTLGGTVFGGLPPLSLHAWLRLDAVRRLLPREARRLLEIGAGQGGAGALLARGRDYVGLEPDAASHAVAERRVGVGRVLRLDDASFSPDEPFDAVCAFEVLEHLEDDRAVLASWRRFLRPGGCVLVSVPAGRERMGAADRRAGHLRRYDRGDVEQLLEGAGYGETAVVAYGFPLGYALEGARNVLSARALASAEGTSDADRTAASGRWLQPPDWAAVATAVASLPFRLAQRPFAGGELGTGFVARARLAE
jgi:SAM-dependent methyltransferase